MNMGIVSIWPILRYGKIISDCVSFINSRRNLKNATIDTIIKSSLPGTRWIMSLANPSRINIDKYEIDSYSWTGYRGIESYKAKIKHIPWLQALPNISELNKLPIRISDINMRE